jgi:hypothetical protein
MRINLYSQQRHVVVWDGISLSGFADGDYLEIKVDGGAASRTHGGDGPSINMSTAQGGTLTLGLLPTSPALGMLYQLRDAQKSNPRLFNIQLITGVEEVISASGCAYGELPGFRTGGPAQSPRQFLAEALQIDLSFDAVEAIDGGMLGGLIP